MYTKILFSWIKSDGNVDRINCGVKIKSQTIFHEMHYQIKSKYRSFDFVIFNTVKIVL